MSQDAAWLGYGTVIAALSVLQYMPGGVVMQADCIAEPIHAALSLLVVLGRPYILRTRSWPMSCMLDKLCAAVLAFDWLLLYVMAKILVCFKTMKLARVHPNM